MNLRIIDLDDSLRTQMQLQQRYQPTHHDLRFLGPQVRLGCSFRRYRQFESALAAVLGSPVDRQPHLSFLGSGDFHHMSLAMVRRIEQPFNLLILDNHPDWMRGIPFLHCGTWVYHAAQLPNLRTIFHIGGDVDFDNGFRWLAPWRAMRAGKIKVISGRRRFQRGGWRKHSVPSLRLVPDRPATPERIRFLLEPFQAELARVPLYVSLDKDVMTADHAIVNWDSGHLKLTEVQDVLTAFIEAAQRRLVGMDVVGDWSPVRLRGMARRLLHWTEHPSLRITPALASERNEETNLNLLSTMSRLLGVAAAEPATADASPVEVPVG